MSTSMARSVRVTASYLPREKCLLPPQPADSQTVMGRNNSLDSGVYGLRDSPNSVLRDSPPNNCGVNHDSGVGHTQSMITPHTAPVATTGAVLAELQPVCDGASSVRYMHHHHHHHHAQSSSPSQPHYECVHPARPDGSSENSQLPEYIIDSKTRTTYLKGKFLGKGGFARVHELIDLTNNRVYAGKIIPHSRITKPHNKEKIAREIDLHRSLRHRHVVRFEHCFEDADNVYIILENCPKKSLVHVLKHRQTLTESEVRYYIRQVADACQYIHSQNIVHRDLKLGNLFLSDDMTVKVGDFGLATRLMDEKKPTICGTPNYIAPEVLDKEGHGFEADRWAIGCIMYAMLVGQPPFETDTLQETYRRIRANQYHLPVYNGDSTSGHMSAAAADLISRLLDPVPARRPSPHSLLQHEFFTSTNSPGLPLHSLPPQEHTVTPRHVNVSSNNGAVSSVTSCVLSRSQSAKSAAITSKLPNKIKDTRESVCSLRQRISSVFRSTTSPSSTSPSTDPDRIKTKHRSSSQLYRAVADCISCMPTETDCNPEQVPHSPLFITKWIDYSNKYGFGFQLSDRSVGVLFNDSTKVLYVSDHSRVDFVGRHGKLCSYRPSEVPSLLQERFTLLRYFGQYMEENLTEGGDTSLYSSCSDSSCGPAASCDVHMKRWVRTQSAIVMQLSNGTIQINFFKDHTKVILSSSPTGDTLVTYINSERCPTSYLLRSVAATGCARVVRDRLKYTCSALHEFAQMDVKCPV